MHSDNVSFGTVSFCSEGHSLYSAASLDRLLGGFPVEEMVLNWAQASGQQKHPQMVNKDNVMICFMPRSYVHYPNGTKKENTLPDLITFF